MTANNDKNRTYSVFYIPKVTGMHKVSCSCCRTVLVDQGGWESEMEGWSFPSIWYIVYKNRHSASRRSTNQCLCASSRLFAKELVS